MIIKELLYGKLNHKEAYEIPSIYDIPYINNVFSKGQICSTNKDNVEYTWCNYIGNLGAFRYKQPDLNYKDVNVELNDISDINECDETIEYSKIHECLGLAFIPNNISTIPIYSLIGYDSKNSCWLIFVNNNEEPTENTKPSYYYNNLIPQ